MTGRAVAEIDRAGKAIVLTSKARIDYDHLVLATGARNRVPPLPGIELDGVCYLRNLAETEDLRQRLASARHCVVIGAGFIGLEFAAIARGKGKPVHIVELVDRVMARVVCPDTSAYFADAHRAAGVEFSFGARVERLGGDGGRVTHVVLQDGRSLPADLVIVSIGVMPNEGLAAAAGLAVENGIVVDEQLLTADPDISAIGDCAVVPVAPFAAKPGASRGGAERDRPCALRRRPADGERRALYRSALVLERAGGAQAADRRAHHRVPAGRAARRLREG